MIVIGISGYKGSGKDTAADIMMEQTKNNLFSKKISLAYPLKKACMDDYGLTKDQCYLQSQKEAPIESMPVFVTDNYAKQAIKNIYAECRTRGGGKPDLGYRIEPDERVICHKTGKQLYWTPRALMIFKGSNQRTVDKDYWVKQTVKSIKKSNDVDLFFIPDVRYKNEIKALTEAFGSSFIPLRITGRVRPQSEDASERDLDDYPFKSIITNDSDWSDFENQLVHFLDYIVER